MVKLHFEKYSIIKSIFYVYIGIILLLVVLPINGKNDELNKVYLLQIRGDYFFHALMFLPWAFFGIKMSKQTFKWIISGVLFALGSEGIQYFLPYRAFNINDIVSNILGALLGFLVFRTAFWMKEKQVIKPLK